MGDNRAAERVTGALRRVRAMPAHMEDEGPTFGEQDVRRHLGRLCLLRGFVTFSYERSRRATNGSECWARSCTARLVSPPARSNSGEETSCRCHCRPARTIHCGCRRTDFWTAREAPSPTTLEQRGPHAARRGTCSTGLLLNVAQRKRAATAGRSRPRRPLPHHLRCCRSGRSRGSALDVSRRHREPSWSSRARVDRYAIGVSRHESHNMFQDGHIGRTFVM